MAAEYSTFFSELFRNSQWTYSANSFALITDRNRSLLRLINRINRLKLFTQCVQKNRSKRNNIYYRICRERQLRLYGHMARLPAEDPAHRIFSCRNPSGWTMPRGRPHASFFRQVEAYLKDTGMTGLASAWAMVRRRPKEYRRKVDAATRCSDVCPHT